MTRRHVKHRQKGVAIVEMAISAPLLVLFLVVLAEAGTLLFQYTNLSKSVIAGARYVADRSVGGFVSPDVVTTARNLIVYGSPNQGSQPRLPGLTVTIQCKDGEQASGSAGFSCEVNDHAVSTLTISASANYQPILGGAWTAVTRSSSIAIPMNASVDQVLL